MVFAAQILNTSGYALEVREISAAGKGVFAGELIPKAAHILTLSGKKVRGQDIDWNTYNKRAMQIGPDLFLEECGGIDDYINHSCEPNITFNNDGTGFIALRDIQAGEELCFDYCTAEYDSPGYIDCACGSSKCRGRFRGFKYLPVEEKKRIIGHALPYIKKIVTSF